tara:strand:- start:46726 stop:49188 length:2463 start_codon:yes stop_codon:yes gene_type:complete
MRASLLQLRSQNVPHFWVTCLLILFAHDRLYSQDAPAQPIPEAEATQFEDILEYADMLFSREQYNVAAQQYQIFIREQPNSPNLQIAWFRLGECYLKVKQLDDGEKTFNYLISQYRKGPFVGSAAYRLAILRLDDKDYLNALVFFKTAKKELTNPKVKLEATYYCARCLQLTQQSQLALAQFNELIEASPAEENPFHERALLESARLHFELGETKLALEKFKELADTASTEAFQQEAVVRGGLLAAEVGQTEISEALLDRALKFSDTSPWKALAQVGAIFNAFAREDYERVIGIYNVGAYTPPDESRAKMLLIVAHSYRLMNDLELALQLYSLVEAKYPEQNEGVEAGYRRIQLLYQTSDKTLPDAADNFARMQAAIDSSNPYIDMAWLMKAEFHFAQAENSASGPGSNYANKNFSLAASAYTKVRLEMVDQKYREICLYKKGWSQIESGDFKGGIVSLTQFIQRHRQSSLSSSAIAKRAAAYQENEDHQYALDDFEDIAKNYPKAPELEFALQQIALIYAHQRKTSEMIAAYQNLLKQFPNTDGAGEAHYWIGVGFFDLEQHPQAIPELKLAREIDSQYDDKATVRLVICHYHLEQIDELAENARRYLEKTPDSTGEESMSERPSIPLQVLEYLGRKLAASRDYEGGEYFLTALSQGKGPTETTASVWELLADCRAELKNHEGVITACDNFLVQIERPSKRASAYLQRGFAQFCLNQFEEAKKSAQESLRSQKEGRTNAEARLLLGDIAAANGNLADAARDYLVVSQIFYDPDVTPKALAKAANAYDSLGEHDKAKQLQQELSFKFPDYAAPAKLTPDR